MKNDEFKCDLDLMEFGSSDSDTSGMGGWSVPWADLMMVMFVLFVVLFIYSQSKENIKVIFSGNAQSQVSPNPVDNLIDMLSVHREAMSGSTKVVLTPQDVLYRSNDGAISMASEDDGQLKIIMRGDAFFAPGRSSFEPKTLQYLAEVAEILRTSNHAIHIVGHTDHSDVAKSGKISAFELSARRAAQVAQYFISEKSIDPARILVSGRGGTVPELPDSMEKVSGNNRRVEIVVINTDFNAE
ncbi:OmpA family protein [Maridesulfovibrio ferrireducens]|uniref:OmpA/MotB family protein n=1 Tax=Maridesulfovibrio ferrireducens TaxID=246191 RepID=UPI001A2AE7D2|nr:OmpA family protein [Maridesulfovibrio ferrireducens]MBI9110517.1 OmpA family protein [Maridesulfovibrio ferrireducens]